MNRHYIIGALLIGVLATTLLVAGKNTGLEKKALSFTPRLPPKLQALIANLSEEKSKALSTSNEIIKKETLTDTSADLEAQIEDIDRVLENSNAFAKMNSDDLDVQTRREFMALIEARQKLLTTLVDRELESSNELLAGTK